LLVPSLVLKHAAHRAERPCTGYPIVALVAAALLGLGLAAVHVAAQERGKSKVPVLDKITSSAMHQAFSGTVQSFDEKHNTLNVSAVEGGVTETFPLKKSTYAYTPDGTRIKVNDLAPGTSVIVYYDLHQDHRTVSRIEILAHESKKQAPHS